MKDKFMRALCSNPDNYDATIKHIRKHHPTYQNMPKRQAKAAAAWFVNDTIRGFVFPGDPDMNDEPFYVEDGLMVSRVPGTDKVLLSVVIMSKENV